VRVLVLCTGNSARSQMAEAIFRRLSDGAVEVASAGTVPKREIHPMARQAIKTLLGIEMTGQCPKPIDEFIGRDFDYVITVCDDAAETCPTFPGARARLHWSFEDPAAMTGTTDERQHAFDVVANELLARIRAWLASHVDDRS